MQVTWENILQTNKCNMDLNMAKLEKIKMKEAMNIKHENKQDIVVTCKDKKHMLDVKK